jgi:hypothetical protein
MKPLQEVESKEGGGRREDRLCTIVYIASEYIQQADEDEYVRCMYACMHVYVMMKRVSLRLNKQSHLKSFLVPV